MIKKIVSFFSGHNKEIERRDNFFREGLRYRDSGNYEKAKEYLEKALELDPNSEAIKLKLWQVGQKAQNREPSAGNNYPKHSSS